MPLWRALVATAAGISSLSDLDGHGELKYGAARHIRVQSKRSSVRLDDRA